MQLNQDPTSRNNKSAVILKKSIIAAATLFFIWGCASTPEHPAGTEYAVIAPHPFDLRDEEAVLERLRNQYREWKSVKYKLGGRTKGGIDCSAFVHLTYLSQFGIRLPKTTAYQSKVGYRISQKRLSAGDLVFFRTGFSWRHVGIFLEDRKFLHVSTKKGVTISSLDDTYWSKKYWKSVRIQPGKASPPS